MKRKLLTLVALVAVLCLSMVGCKLWFESYTEISIVEAPKSQYYVGESLAGTTIVIKAYDKVSGKEDTITVTYDANGQYKATATGANYENAVDITTSFSITNFQTASQGSFTAKIAYNDATCEFGYTVLPAEEVTGFAGGDGSVGNPYLVSNATQFANIVLQGYKAQLENKDKPVYTYYKLTSDIDFSGVDIGSMTASDGLTYNQIIDTGFAVYPKAPIYSFYGSIDGSAGAVNYKLKNFQATADNVSLFGNIADGTFTNIDVVGFNTVGYRSSAFGSNAYYDVNGVAYGTGVGESSTGGGKVTFKNVNILQGNKLGYGGYLVQAKKANNVVFEDCTMSGTIISDGNNVGGFIGANTGSASVVFRNCVMNGSVTGVSVVGGYIGWHSAQNLSFINSTLAGPVTALAGTAGYAAGGGGFIKEEDAKAKGLIIASDITVDSKSDSFTFDDSSDKITVSAKTTLSNVAYYRVMYTGNVDHYILQDGKYVKHFNGGYATPLKVSVQYKDLAAVNADANMTKKYNGSDIKNGNIKSYVGPDAEIHYTNAWVNPADGKEKNNNSKYAIVWTTDATADQILFNGYTEGSHSLIIYQANNLNWTIIAYNQEGEPIAAGTTTGITIGDAFSGETYDKSYVDLKPAQSNQ